MAKTLIGMSDSRSEQFGARTSGMAPNPRLMSDIRLSWLTLACNDLRLFRIRQM